MVPTGDWGFPVQRAEYRNNWTGALRLRKQRTLKNSIRCAGMGLHCERKVELVFRPAGPGAGIVFKRTDRPCASRNLPALWKNAKASDGSSDLEMRGGPKVAGVVQLLSAAAAADLDNLIVELAGPEVPILDGSAEPFLFLTVTLPPIESFCSMFVSLPSMSST